MNTGLSPELADLVDAVEILTPSAFRIGGNEFEVGGPRPLFTPGGPDVAPSSTAEDALRRSLTDALYNDWYARAPGASAARYDENAHRDHARNLSLANSGSGAWEPGWLIRDVAGDGRVAVEGYGLVFVTSSREVRTETGRLAPGQPCRVRVPCEMRALRPGFYSASGEADPAAPGTLPWLVRLYWHLRPGGASAWIHLLTTGLNRRRIPFRLKVVADPRNYLRADAGLLILEPEHYREARPVVRDAYDELRGQLRAPVPGLTRELAPGLSVAEGAADGASFGGQRCEIVAAALVGATQAAADGKERAERVASAFGAAGLNPARPHLAPGSTSEYRRLELPDQSRSVAMPPPGAAASETPDPLLGAARIGDALCRSAHHGQDRCNWIGRDFERDSATGEVVEGLAALGPALYGGTAGVALFLGELYQTTGESEYHDTARAAIRQALSALEREPDRTRAVAFFEGQLGIAWSARELAGTLDDEALATEADGLISSIARDLPGEHLADLVEGNAGAVIALLRIHEQTGEPRLLDAAIELGLELLKTTPGPRLAAGTAPPPLTGLAHGAAGVGLALLELFAATGDETLRDAADRHFGYELACFDSARRNWPDFRGLARDEAGLPVGEPGYMTAWCHGAPGIALARLRAMEIDVERASSYEPAARAGLATTVQAIERDLVETPEEICLCHGLAGLAEVVLVGARVLNEPALEEVAMLGMERLLELTATESRRRLDPSLFTGDAGVGYALLRFDHPERFATLLLPGEPGAEERHAGNRIATAAGDGSTSAHGSSERPPS